MSSSENKDQRVKFMNQSYIDPKSDKDIQLALSRNELIYSIAGLIAGLTCTLGGMILFLNGISGTSNWTVKILELESEITDSAPGVILFIVGLFVVFITKYKFTHKKSVKKYIKPD